MDFLTFEYSLRLSYLQKQTRIFIKITLFLRI
jgi:hypothetical protein